MAETMQEQEWRDQVAELAASVKDSRFWDMEWSAQEWLDLIAIGHHITSELHYRSGLQFDPNVGRQGLEARRTTN